MGYRLDGFVVSGVADKEYYKLFGFEASAPGDIDKWLASGDKDMTLHINSYGGDIYAGSQMYTAIKQHGGVDVIVDGLAASIASVIMCGGKTVRIAPTGQIMVHNVSMYCEGDYRDMEHSAEELRVANSAIKNAYMLKTGLSDNQLQGYMDNETWFDAQESLQLRFVDEILFNSSGASAGNILPGLTAGLYHQRQKVAAMRQFSQFAARREQSAGEHEASNAPYNNGLFLLQTQINKNNLRRTTK